MADCLSGDQVCDGRWLTPDMLGGDVTNPQSLNRYAYALNNPATLTDPLGLDPYDGGPGENCNDPAYADSHAKCGWSPCWGLTPEGWSQSNCSGLPGVIGGGSGGGSMLPPVPPAGQPPLAGGTGGIGWEPGVEYPPTGVLPWGWIIHITKWGSPYFKGALLASSPLLHLGLHPVADHPTTGLQFPPSPAVKFLGCTAVSTALAQTCLESTCLPMSEVPELAGACGLGCGLLYLNREKNYCKKNSGIR